jgi:hypothetical protein
MRDGSQRLWSMPVGLGREWTYSTWGGVSGDAAARRHRKGHVGISDHQLRLDSALALAATVARPWGTMTVDVPQELAWSEWPEGVTSSWCDR